MKKRTYPIVDDDILSVVYETKRQRDILSCLDELLENYRYANENDWEYIFSDVSFYIEYKDGTTYYADCTGEDGVYKKRNISRIIYTNPVDTVVYGEYVVNEYGIVQ